MAIEKNSAGRYGVRYGRKLREKIGKIEQIKRDTNTCPYCHYSEKVERQAAGIWYCGKCKSKFTGRAYYIGRKLEGVEKAAAKETEAAAAEEEEDSKEDYEEKAEAVQNG
jgi:large subunit ribosomal protein L37Ae